jgi:hypothetical protein
MKAEAVHAAVPLDLEVTVTDNLVSTLAMAAVVVVAGEEAGPKGEDSMAENSTVSLFFFYFFFSPAFGWYQYQLRDGFFFFLFSNTEQMKRFFGLRKNNKHEDPFFTSKY